MDAVKKHFESEAREFDLIILKLIPHYPEMIDALVSAIPHERSSSIKVIDLGCGTGAISRKTIDLFPRSKITCIDLSENMIGMARIKLKENPGIRYQVGDFRSYEFDDKYDVVATSLALHHLETDAEKIKFYEKIHDSLNPGGMFINADVVLGSSPHLQSVYMEKWKQFMLKHVSEDEIENKWLQKYLEEDRPARLMDHISWLSEVGFSEIDIVWKYYNFAVYCGHRG